MGEPEGLMSNRQRRRKMKKLKEKRETKKIHRKKKRRTRGWRKLRERIMPYATLTTTNQDRR